MKYNPVTKTSGNPTVKRNLIQLHVFNVIKKLDAIYILIFGHILYLTEDLPKKIRPNLYGCHSMEKKNQPRKMTVFCAQTMVFNLKRYT